MNGHPLQSLTHAEAVQQLRCAGATVVLRIKPNHALEGQAGGYTLVHLIHAQVYSLPIDIFSADGSKETARRTSRSGEHLCHRQQMMHGLAARKKINFCMMRLPTSLCSSAESVDLGSHLLLPEPTTLMEEGWEELPSQTGPLPQGWGEKIDHRTGRPYFEK